jgi:uncharacterized protein (DUF1499 family)
MLIGLLVVAVALAGFGWVVRLNMSRAAEDALRPEEHIAIVDLRDPMPGNAFLACPPNYCAATAVASPVFAMAAQRLGDYLDEVIAGESSIVRVAQEPAQHRLVLVQHSLLLRFPDVVTVEFVAFGPERSSLAIYSRARYGRGDFGVNRKRVLRWLGRLAQIAPPASAQ